MAGGRGHVRVTSVTTRRALLIALDCLVRLRVRLSLSRVFACPPSFFYQSTMPGGSRFDFSIRGDEQEQHRIQLEHNLQHTDLSLHLSSTPEDYSLEYPRHNSAPSAPFSVFHSIDPSRDDYDADDRYSHLHAWSYRTAEDEDGVNPYGGETMSTAAHHASALTLSAGLGGRGARRDISLSGAEYDPDRPLHDLVANIDSKFSLFDADRTRSRNFPVSASLREVS